MVRWSGERDEDRFGHRGCSFGRAASWPSCGAPSPIAPSDELWPPTWRCASCSYVLPRATGFAQLAAPLDETNEGFDLEGIDPLATVEEDHFWFGNRNELVRWLVRRHAPA